jgi:hypothetical protein
MKFYFFVIILSLILFFLITLINAETTFFDNSNNVFIMNDLLSNEISTIPSETGQFGGFFNPSFNYSNITKLTSNKLFYVGLDLKKDILKNKEDLVALINFENFGNNSLIVGLTFQILDSNENLIHQEKDFVIVQTNTLVTKTFSNLNLKGGNYHFILTASDNKNINYNLFQNFAVEPLSLKDFLIYVFNKRLTEVAVISLLISGFFLYSFLLRKLRYKKGKNRLIVIRKNF